MMITYCASIYMTRKNKSDIKRFFFKIEPRKQEKLRKMHYLALMGKFWLRSRISFKESNFGTDKILDAAWKLRSGGN